MSTAEIRPPDGSRPPKHARAERTDRADGTGPIALHGLTKPGVDEVAAIPGPRTARGRHTVRMSYATGPIAVPDAALAAAAATNEAAFAAIYRRYGDALYSFCLGMLRDPDAAADCVHDVFVTAATRLGQLREHDKLRSWLYAIARHEALRRLKHRHREQATDELPDTPDLSDGPEHALGRRELTELVAAATGGLSDRERAVLELHYRQGLDGPALADALGVSATNANTMVGRLRGTVERSLAALLVARHQGEKCPDLATVLAGWDGQLTVLMRKRIARHIDHCPACTQARRDLVDPRALLASAPIAIPAPGWLEQHVLHATAPLAGNPAPAAAAHAAVAKGASWWPAGLGASTPTIVAAAAPAAAAVMLLPILLLGGFNAAPESVASSAVAADSAPGLLDPNGTATATSARRGFAIDPSTTRVAPTANPPQASGSPGATNAPAPSGQQPPSAAGGSALPGSFGAAASPGTTGPAPQPRGRRGTHKGTPPGSVPDPLTNGHGDPRQGSGRPTGIRSGPETTTTPPPAAPPVN